MVLENIVGNLRDAYKQVVPGTMLHSDQLQAARLTDASLQNLGFHTADGNIYHLKEDGPHLAMTREKYNPILLHIEDAFAQLTKTRNYRPSAEDVRSALASPSTVHINLAQVRLQGDDAERSYLAIPTKEYNTLNEEERKLAERVHGSGSAFAATMNMLATAAISTTRVYVLRSGYVREHAKEGAIGRASWVGYFNDNSNLFASGRGMDNSGRLRGLRRPARESEVFTSQVHIE